MNLASLPTNRQHQHLRNDRSLLQSCREVPTARSPRTYRPVCLCQVLQIRIVVIHGFLRTDRHLTHWQHPLLRTCLVVVSLFQPNRQIRKSRGDLSQIEECTQVRTHILTRMVHMFMVPDVEADAVVDHGAGDLEGPGEGFL